jgi:hypothetical protein
MKGGKLQYRHDIAEILLKVALNTINQIKSNHRILIPLARSIFNNIWEITDNRVSMMNIKNKSRYTGVKKRLQYKS